MTYYSIMELQNNPMQRFEKGIIKYKYISNLKFALKEIHGLTCGHLKNFILIAFYFRISASDTVY